MKKLLWFIPLLLVSFGINGQNYTVGVPVDDTICSIPFSAQGDCFPDYDFYIDFPPSTVTGIKHILIFAGVSPTDSVYTIPGDTINTGDTMFITQLQPVYFYFLSNGGIDCIFKAIGTPQIANETYYCGNWIWSGGLSICMNWYAFQYSSVCSVSVNTGVNESDNSGQDILISPNPSTTLITIQLPPQFEQATTIEVYDHIGQLVLRMDYSAEVDVSALPAGLFFLLVSNENGERVTGRFVKN